MQIKDLIINDGTADKTLSVVSSQAGSTIPAAWRSGTSAVNALRAEAITRRVKGARRSKAEIRFVQPVVQTKDGVESLVETATFAFTATLPDVLSMSDRKKLRASFLSFVNSDVIAAIIEQDSPAY